MFSLYIHIPFCVGKCHYCGFYSTVYSSQTADMFLSAFKLEASGYETAFNGRVFDTVYIGGGTPTVLSLHQLKILFAIIKAHFDVSPQAEWTLEANPNTVSDGLLSFLKESGINRLSLGIQSFSDDLLNFLGRVHTARHAVEAFKLARTVGFHNIGIDLIYGIPGQSERQWKGTLDRALELNPEHVSAYSLSLDEGSRFRKESEAGTFIMPDDESAARFYECCVEELSAAGYKHYEISNFSRPGFACRHNMNYWERREYLGLGPGAWSFVDGRRYQNTADVHRYSAQLNAGLSVIGHSEWPDASQAANEKVMLALRTSRGIDLMRYEREYGADSRQRLVRHAERLKRFGLVMEAAGVLRLTRSGFLLANDVLARLF